MKRIVSKLSAIILCMISASSFAADPVELSGFGTLGLVSTDSDYYGYRKDISRPNGAFKHDLDLKSDSTFGLQLDTTLGDTLDAVYQAVYLDQESRSLDNMTSMAFARYSPNVNWSIRAGRTPIDLFLINEYRDVGFAYTWAQAPTEVYGMIPFRHMDGIDITYSKRLNDLTFRTKFSGGKSKATISSYEYPEEVKVDDLYGLSLALESFNWTLKAQFSRLKMVENTNSQFLLINALSQLPDAIWPNAQELGQEISLKNQNIQYSSISGRYDIGNWEFLSEFTFTASESPVIPDLFSGYVSVIRKYDAHAFYLIASFTDSNNFDIQDININEALLFDNNIVPGGSQIYTGVDTNLNFYASNQNTISLGCRWDLFENLALKVQFDHTNIKQNGGTLWLQKNSDYSPGDTLSPKETVNRLSTNLSFVF